MDDGVPIEEVVEVTDEIVAAVAALTFQLSPRRAAPDAEVLRALGPRESAGRPAAVR